MRKHPLKVRRKDPKPFVDKSKKYICALCGKEIIGKKCRQYLTTDYYHEPCWFAKD